MLFRANRLRCAFAFIVFATCVPSAFAQWAWRDSSGHPVYSDVPPPPNTPVSDILQQPNARCEPQTPDTPGQGGPNRPATAAPLSTPPAGTTAHAPTVAEQEQAFRKRMKERSDAERKQADEQAQAARDAESCQRVRGYLRALEDGVRIVRTNPDGTRDSLDEQQREGEVERTHQAIRDTCK